MEAGPWRALVEHARASLPEEACGILVGRCEGACRTVVRAIPCRNAHEGDRRRRFLIDPEQQTAAQREAREAGLEIVGYYHSHPAGSAAPSGEDLRQAHPWVSNLILAFRGAALAEARSWRVDSAGRAREEPVAVAGVTWGPGSASRETDDG